MFKCTTKVIVKKDFIYLQTIFAKIVVSQVQKIPKDSSHAPHPEYELLPF